MCYFYISAFKDYSPSVVEKFNYPLKLWDPLKAQRIKLKMYAGQYNNKVLLHFRKK